MLMLLATLLLSLAPAPLPVQTAQENAGFDRDNVVICLDASGSMRDALVGAGSNKMEAAKRAIEVVLRTVPAETQVGLLVFSGRHKTQDWVFPLGPRNDAELVRRMQPITGSGKTPLGRYLKEATDVLLGQRQKQSGYGSFRLLVVTDGQATDGDVLDTFLPDVLRRGIVVDVIGVAMKSRHVLATKVHSYRSADDAFGLQTAITEVFAEMQDLDSADSVANYELLDAFPDNAVQGVIDLIAVRNDEPIGVIEVAKRRLADAKGQQQAPSGTVSYGDNNAPSKSTILKFLGGSGLVCFLAFIIAVTVFFKVVKILRK